MLNNKIVIADTSPLISMIKIKRLDLLEELFGSIVIPEAVFNELTDNNIYKDEADCIIKADFIKRKPVAEFDKYFKIKIKLNLKRVSN